MAADRVPAPVIHSSADNGITVNVDDHGRGDDYLAITQALAEAKRKRAGRLVFAKRIRDNRFHDHRGRGVYLSAKNVCIENNLFSTSPSMAIAVSSAEDVAIRNNRFENVGYARDPQAGRAIGHEYRGEISVVATYDKVTVEGSTWTDMNHDHELVWFE